MKRIILILLSLFVFSCEPSVEESQSLKLATSALESYRKGLDSLSSGKIDERSFVKSEELLRLLGRDYPNQELFLALGHSAFWRKEFPLAIYYYREADSFGYDKEVRASLNAARKQLGERIEVPIQEKIFQGVFFFHFWIPFAFRLAILLIVLWCLGILAALWIFKGRIPRWGVFFLIVGVTIFIAEGSSLSISLYQLNYRQEGVLLQETEGRSGDHLSYDESYLHKIPAGSEVKILERRNEWSYVQLSNRSRCWIPNESVAFIGDSLQ